MLIIIFLLPKGTLWLNSRLSSINVPVTILAGTADRLLPSVKEAKYLASVIPDAEVIILKGHGHAAVFDNRISLLKIIANSTSMSVGHDEKKSVSENNHNNKSTSTINVNNNDNEVREA